MAATLLTICYCFAILSASSHASNMNSLLWDLPKTNNIAKRNTQRDFTIRDCSDPENIYLPPTAVITTERLNALRNSMGPYDAYIIPGEDEHLTEYVAPRSKRREYISGFSGSNGVAVVTKMDASLWTDGRYFLHSEREMDCNWKLMKLGEPETPSIEEWLENTLNPNSLVGAYPYVFSIASWDSYSESLRSRSLNLTEDLTDIVGQIWTDRPGTIGTEVIVFPIKYAGKAWENKIVDVREKMADENADYLLLTKLDEIAWLFNLRGNDIPYTPVFASYALISQTFSRIYVNMSQAESQELSDHLNIGCVQQNICGELREYNTARDDLLSLPEMSKVWMSEESTNYAMYNAIDPERIIVKESPIKIPKSIKNQVEVEAMKQAQIFDAVALCEYFIWLEENVPLGKVDELSGSEKLEQIRWSQTKSKGPSFKTISGSGPNAALPHYETSLYTNRNLTTDEIYLVDSGGHYFEGTTDTTRTLHFGTPSDFQKETYTRVLMGVMNIETAIFPSTIDGNDIGMLARQPLYDVGLDYRHGSGHGVGQYLTIHEYPPGVGTAGAEGYPFQVGMFTSIEPGYYQDNEFGIRIENVITVVEANTEYNFGSYSYLTFESTTLVPMEKKLIDVDILNDEQLEYLNDYHAKVMDIVGKEALNQEKQFVYDWLKTATGPIIRNGSDKLVPSFSLFTVFFIAIIRNSVDLC